MGAGFQLLIILGADRADNVIPGGFHRLFALIQFVLNVTECGCILVEKVVFFGKPHFQKGCVQIVRDFHIPQLGQQQIQILIGEKTRERNQENIECIGKDDLVDDLHCVFPICESPDQFRSFALLLSDRPVPDHAIGNH